MKADLLITLALVLVLLLSAAAGWAIRAKIDERHLSRDRSESIRLLMGMLLTFAALVLGLLTSNAKQRFDGLNDELSRFATTLIELNHGLRAYGPEADATRSVLRRYTAAAVASSWPDETPPAGDYELFHRAAKGIEGRELGAMLETVKLAVLEFVPADTFHRNLLPQVQARAAQALDERWKLIFAGQSTMSWPFLLTLATWLAIIFAVFGMTSPQGRMIYAVVVLSALSIASPVYLILDYDDALNGTLALSSAPLREALAHMDAR